MTYVSRVRYVWHIGLQKGWHIGLSGISAFFFKHRILVPVPILQLSKLCKLSQKVLLLRALVQLTKSTLYLMHFITVLRQVVFIRWLLFHGVKSILTIAAYYLTSTHNLFLFCVLLLWGSSYQQVRVWNQFCPFVCVSVCEHSHSLTIWCKTWLYAYVYFYCPDISQKHLLGSVEQRI